MGPHGHRTITNDLPNQVTGALFDGIVKLAPDLFLSRYAFGDSIAAPMRLERPAEKRLVEMDMPVDETGDEKRPCQIDPLFAFAGGKPRTRDLDDAARIELKVGAPAVGEHRVGEKDPGHAISLTRRAAAT
jgi:hypothetical protein